MGCIENCYNVGRISGGTWAGGIAGNTYKENISNCYNAGIISGNNIAGISQESNQTSIINCYNLGNINATRYAAGILVEVTTSGEKVENCYNIGIIKSDTLDAGGIVCDSKNVSILDCAYLKGTAECEYIVFGTKGRKTKVIGNVLETVDQMPTVLSVINSDNAFVEDTEGINSGYPLLAWQVEATD